MGEPDVPEDEFEAATEAATVACPNLPRATIDNYTLELWVLFRYGYMYCLGF